MSRQLLSALNGDRTGELNKFLDTFEGEPRIAWYPSAGEDFRALMYLHPNFSKSNEAKGEEPSPPDIFLYTDYFPWRNSAFLDTRTIYADSRTVIFIESIISER